VYNSDSIVNTLNAKYYNIKIKEVGQELDIFRLCAVGRPRQSTKVNHDNWIAFYLLKMGARL
jgi:hypothetical protein